MSALFSPFRRTYSYLPAVYYSIWLGFLGPVMVVTVPEIRKRFFGYKPVERPPTSYPLPNRPREATEGYEDGWELKA
ncbi:hypothetical protein C6P46_001733 [Rhodotorula mucilaginosa]|uniref:NADH-ubiquinone oxidoreductase 9.5 kDa subunit n=1 Tax=Rhodotorula mucilaginosa TaxID=5537 RepID=A0A9P6W6R3_RHOMI|nr:hypothetical protein C6P46_001733 [Rhodotorula mucilaginosa]TKA54657.1 hypothetical protein B0A53_03064 [Rhodotorula sp. CCFEE 5036]